MRSSAVLFGAALLLAAALAGGCGRGRDAAQVRAVRLAGHPDSARTLALSLLNENANRIDVWHEFARSSLEMVRLRPDEEEPENGLEVIVQSGLVCSAVYQNKKRQPPAEWRDTGKMLSAEVARQISSLITTMSAQMQQANLIRPLLTPIGPDTLVPRGPEIRAQQLLVNYRTGARRLLYWSVVLRRILENLPEVNPGTASLVAGQLDEASSAWTQALELDPAYISVVQVQARQAIDTALGKSLSDLQDLGYFVPQTIIENGVGQ